MQNNTTINIDLEVYKAIIHHSNYINEPANDVLKRVFNLKKEVFSEQNKVTSELGGLNVKGVFLKSGLKLQKHFKGTLFEAIVRNGYIEFNKKRYTSPSGAAVIAAQGSVNGWRFWNFFDETDNKWKILETLRN
jgi:hypothetical protein